MSEPVDKALSRNETTNRWIKRLVALAVVQVMVFVILMGVGMFWTITETRDQSKRNFAVLLAIEAQSRQVEATQRVVLAVTGCQIEDTPEACTERFRAGSKREGDRRIIEVDCLTRRALAGLPAPDPTQPCVPQTPPNVYPGK